VGCLGQDTMVFRFSVGDSFNGFWVSNIVLRESY